MPYLEILAKISNPCHDSVGALYVCTYIIIEYRSLEKIRHEKVFVRRHVRQKLNTRKFSYHKEIE